MLTVDHLVRRFGRTVALDGVSFGVQRGAMMGFVGPNGAGKTTAMRIVLGLLAPDGGEVRWDGGPLTTSVRRRFGYMPEERGLYAKMRCADQLAYFAALHGLEPAPARDAADRWLERLGLTERGGEPVEKLSLGNQQRVQLAAALVHEPDALVLDEPFSGLDPVGVDVLAAVLRRECDRGVAVVFSSHQLELVERLCDTVTIVKDGRVVAAGAVDELRRANRPRLLRVDVEGARPGWEAALDGVRVVGRDDGKLTVELLDGADDQVVLDEARRAGRLRRFAPVEPTLAEIFREVVA